MPLFPQEPIDPQVTSRVSTLYTSAARANLSGRIGCEQRHAVDAAASHRAASSVMKRHTVRVECVYRRA